LRGIFQGDVSIVDRQYACERRLLKD